MGIEGPYLGGRERVSGGIEHRLPDFGVLPRARPVYLTAVLSQIQSFCGERGGLRHGAWLKACSILTEGCCEENF